MWEWDAPSLARLQAFLEMRGLVAGPLTTTRIGDGHSNLTYLISDGEQRIVLRRPPPPPTPPGAHDMLREAALLRGLADSAVPLPEVLATADAGEILDVPCYLMTFVDGPVVTTDAPGALRDCGRQIGFSLVDTLADLHAVDVTGSGLAELGRPAGYNARHLQRMGRLISADGRLPDGFAGLAEILAARVPAESGAAVVHNDFRLGNVVLAPDPPGRVMAVLDWELATLADPLHDLAYLLVSVPSAGEPMTATQRMGSAWLAGDFPSRNELARRYAARTGADLSRLPWYQAFALWKLAVLYEYGRRRAIAGVGDPYYADPAHVRSFLAAAQQIPQEA